MWISLVLASALMQQPSTGTATLSAKVVDAIDRNYLYVDTDSWKRLRTDLLSNTDTTVSSMDQQLAKLHDGDLRIITSQQMAAMQAETAGKEQGIGLVDFAVTVEPSTGDAKVVTPLVTSPAFKAGLQPGDVIVSVNGRTTRGLIHEDVMAMLRGNSGKIDLTIRRDNRQIQMQVSKEAWIEQAVDSHSLVADKQQLGYISVRLFTSDSGEQVRQAVDALTIHGVNKCIIDLRNNPGGYLDAMAVAGSAFTDQTLGWKVRRDGTKEPIRATGKPFKAMQLVVLVNEGTASAAEVLAAALRDTTGARLVGARTYGRGQIQTYVALNESAGIVIPAASAESVKAIRFNKGSGLSPDVFVASTIGTQTNDVAYQRAVELLTHG
ncbi:PDZ domain-containing protein [Granulicella sp. WH15]|uniref:S41 family peptidase n=1 Tax=Granulicella sp. WH15 TaxID=2602070 RepID=UPI0013673CDE|nr:S41 family peptidase [Granulicella sp. WH15]QHN04756.1 PDZ domain-containing protein [Granulicella sp. WH15]